jgi:hypothetical protein
MLGETIVHGEDIRRPLGIERDYPVTTLTISAEYYQGSDLSALTKGRARDLRLTAPTVLHRRCRAGGLRHHLAPVMAMAGRTPYCDELDGDGVAILRERHVPAR